MLCENLWQEIKKGHRNQVVLTALTTGHTISTPIRCPYEAWMIINIVFLLSLFNVVKFVRNNKIRIVFFLFCYMGKSPLPAKMNAVSPVYDTLSVRLNYYTLFHAGKQVIAGKEWKKC